MAQGRQENNLNNKSQGARNSGKPQPQKRKLPAGLLFWIAFFIVIILLFLINMPLIKRTLEDTHVIDRILKRQDVENDSNLVNNADEEQILAPEVSIIPQNTPTSQGNDQRNAPVNENPLENVKTNENPVNKTQVITENPAKPPLKPPVVQNRERVLYFIQVDNSGLIYTAPVTRNVPVSDSPLIDVLNLLFTGPTSAERSRGLSSLIPEGTRLLSASVKNGTVTINLSENFMFNSYGAEGYISQLRQLVYTATEFPSVRNVQILIEGRKVDFLAENIPTRDPIGRETL